MTMTNLKHVEHNPLSMSIEEASRKTRKGYQYVPDIPTAEPPLPPKRERKKVKYNDYINPVQKTVRKSPTRKRSPLRKNKKAHRPVKKQKLANDTVEVFQTLTDKKRELEEKLHQINADLALADAQKLAVDSDSEDDVEMEDEVEVEEKKTEIEDGKDEEDAEIDNNDDNKESNVKEENGNLKENEPKENGDQQVSDPTSESKENIETVQENINNEAQQLVSPTKTTPKKTPKKPKRKRSTKKKKEAKEAKSVDPKRAQRVTRTSEALTAQEIQAANQIAFTKVLNSLMKHRYSSPFLQPVDPIALNIPDYLTIIKNPMDFGTIKAKLENNAYRSPKEFADDVNLVFTNACTYNQPGSDVYIMSTSIQEVFIKKMNPILTKQGFPLLSAPQFPTLPSTRSPSLYAPVTAPIGFNELKKTVDALRKELVSLRSMEKSPAKVVKVEKEPLIPMTRDEKRKLSSDINKLSSEHLGMVVKIIKQKMPIGDVDEIVIDIDSLDTSTLRDLEQYVLKVRKKKKGSRRVRANNTRSSQPINNETKGLDEKKIGENELTAQKLDILQKRLNELSNNTNERNLLTNSTTIAFANPLEEPVEVKNENEDAGDESESESASDTDSDASSSESGSDNESGSESESENLDGQN